MDTNAAMTIVDQTAGLDTGITVQFVKYMIAGCLGTTVHLIFFNILSWKVLPALQEEDLIIKTVKLRIIEVDDNTRSRNSMINNGIMFVFSSLIVYFMNIYWVFKPARHNMLIEVGLFYATALIALVAGTGTMGFLIKKYGTKTTHAFLINIAITLVINYVVRKFIIFSS